MIFDPNKPFYDQIIANKHKFNFSVENLFLGFYKKGELVEVLHYKGERFTVNGSYYEDFDSICYTKGIDTVEICHNHPDYYGLWPSSGDVVYTLNMIKASERFKGCIVRNHTIINRGDGVFDFLASGFMAELNRVNKLVTVYNWELKDRLDSLIDKLLEETPEGKEHWAFVSRDNAMIAAGTAPKEWVTSKLGRVQRRKSLMSKCVI